jgi:cysteine synthase
MSNILSTIGNTPLVDVSGLLPLPPRTQVLAKVEGSNPGGSIKDRRPCAWSARPSAPGRCARA